MHEMALCEGVLQILESEAKKQGFRRVKQVWIEIGELAGVEIEAFRFCFDAVMNNSLAQQARLNLEHSPGQAWCMLCSKTVAVRQRFDACPDCGSHQLQITGGDQMRIKELEVE